MSKRLASKRLTSKRRASMLPNSVLARTRGAPDRKRRQTLEALGGLAYRRFD
jgi:hypothetical protein